MSVHYLAKCRCRICARTHFALYPATIANDSAQQCPHCEHFTAEPAEPTPRRRFATLEAARAELEVR